MEMLKGEIVKCILQRRTVDFSNDAVVQCRLSQLSRQNDFLRGEIAVVDLFAPQNRLCFLHGSSRLVEVECHGIIEVTQRILGQEMCACASDEPLKDRNRQAIVFRLNSFYHLQHVNGLTGANDRVERCFQIAVAQKAKIEIDKGVALHIFLGKHFPGNGQRILYQFFVDRPQIEDTHLAKIEQEVFELLTCCLDIRRILRHISQTVDELIEEDAPHRVHGVALGHEDCRSPLRPSYLESLGFKRLTMKEVVERLGKVIPRTHVLTILNTPTTTVFDRTEPPFKKFLRDVFQHFYPCFRLEIILLHIIFVRLDALYDLALIACQKTLRTLQAGVEHGRAPFYNIGLREGTEITRHHLQDSVVDVFSVSFCHGSVLRIML